MMGKRASRSLKQQLAFEEEASRKYRDAQRSRHDAACIKENEAYQAGGDPGYLEWWIDALMTLDQDGEKKLLTEMLRSDCELTPLAREYLADLIERGVSYPPHHPKLPAYQRGISDLNESHWFALNDVAAYRKAGMPLEAALEKAAKEYSLNVSSLRLSFEGKNTSFRRARVGPKPPRK